MGVDIEAYRCRIGTFKFAVGNDVVTINCMVNLSGGVKVVGSVLFIGLLLLMSGIESNPGPKDNDAGGESGVIHVSAIPKGVDKAFLLMVFRNTKKHGGGKINNIRFDEERRSALIQFEDPATVQSVLLKRPIVILGAVVEVDEVTSDAGFQQALCSSSTVEVSGIQMTDSIKSLLEYYFDDEESSGGGNVVDIKITESGNALVTFETLEVAQRVVDKGEHSIQEHTITVSPYTEDGSSTVSMEISSAQLKAMNIGEKKKQTVQMEDVQIELQEHSESENKIKGDAKDKLAMLLKETALSDKYPNGISAQDVLSIDIDKSGTHEFTIEELPWVLLRRIISVQSKARDLSVANEAKEDNVQTENAESGLNLFDLLQVEDTSPERNDISPFDIFLLTIQCCDPMLKQLLFHKLYLCKIALPFLLPDRTLNEWEMLVWPFRSLVVESADLSHSSQARTAEFEMLDLPVKTVTFANFGRPQFSKSKLMNDLLSDDIQDTFFNMNCPSGMAQKCLSNGIIEMFALPAVDKDKDRFKEAVTLFNMRGSIESDFPDEIIDLSSKLSDIFVVMTEKTFLETHLEMIEKTLSRFKAVIIIITNPMDKPSLEKLKPFYDNLSSTNILLKIGSTHTGNSQKNPKEISSQLQNMITTLLINFNAKSLENRLDKLPITRTDEKIPDCITGKKKALGIIQSMKNNITDGKWKSSVAPVHFIHSKNLGTQIKLLYRSKDIKETRRIERNIKEVRETQLKSVSKPVTLFIQSATNENDSPILKEYLFRWLGLFLEREKRNNLPCLVGQHQSHLQRLADLRNTASPDVNEIDKLAKLVDRSHEQIENATLGIEHLFRETGHIYESMIVLNKSPDAFELPPIKTVVQTMASFLRRGHTFEIIDGDNFYLPINWVRSVLQEMSQTLNTKVLTLSILGIQSSGKSTLLNCFFGSKFPVKSGRCTRGVHMQILPLSSTSLLPFNYVTIIDSEGLRATELRSRGHSHDNELSTVIAGLGDITLLNVMGENTNEIRDIVQVVVHAFLKLKLVNKHLDIGKRFYLVHQNVIDISARDNLRTGLHVLIETLNEAVKNAGEIEGIREITTFSQVIDFDINTNVWYLPNYWQGNPPMARVNACYSERLCDQRYKLFEKALLCKDKSFKSLYDIAVHTEDLWKGVLMEDFVFCFRNSLEIKSYIQMEETLKSILINFENAIESQHLSHSQELFSGCSNQKEIHVAAETLFKRMRHILTETMSVAILEVKQYCQQSDNKDTILQWEDFAVKRVKSLCCELEDRIKTETIRLRDRTLVALKIKFNRLKLEAELYDRSLEAAKDIKDDSLPIEEIEKRFEETWEIINKDILQFRDKQDVPVSLGDDFEKCLFDIFSTEKLILNSELQKERQTSDQECQCEGHYSRKSVFQNMKKLSGSFDLTGISLDDISFTAGKGREETDIKLSQVEKVVDEIFGTVDGTIEPYLENSDELTYREIRRVLLRAHKEICQAQMKDTGFTFKITGIVKLVVHVSYFAQAHFERHNAEFQNNSGVFARLENYKSQVREQFIAFVRDRKVEETAAKQISVILENTLWDKMKERFQFTLKAALMQNLPQLKFHLIIEVLKDLANSDDFDSFIKYIKSPKTFVKQWMKAKAEVYLFDSDMNNFSQHFAGIVNDFYDNIKLSFDQSCDSFKGENVSTERLIECFTKQFSKCSIDKSEFRNVTKVLGQIEDMRNFKSILVENLEKSVANVKKKARQQAKDIVNLDGSDSPLKHVLKQSWGCTSQCPFCGEPCAKGFSHDGANHYSLQHRITCVSGGREDYTKKAFLTSCNYNVQSILKHHCDLFGFRCNPEGKKPCQSIWHNYQDYKEFVPDWDIEPNANMQDCSKFWMWFVAKYKYQLAVHYYYDVSDIPDMWDDITKDEALANLTRIYSPL